MRAGRWRVPNENWRPVQEFFLSSGSPWSQKKKKNNQRKYQTIT